MSRLRLFPRVAALLLAATIAVTVAPVSAADPLEINAIVPMTGFAAFIGKGYAAAFAAVEADVNKHGGVRGRPIHFVISDDAGNPQTTVQLFDGLVAKNVNVVLGAALVAECAAMIPRIKDGPLLYCLTPAVTPVPGGFVFSAEPATPDQTVALVHYLKSRGLTRIGVLTTTDASGQDADRTIAHGIEAPENSGVTEVAHEHFNPGDLSVTAQLERIKAANPDVLIAWATGTPFGTALRGINDTGLNVPVVTNNGNMTYAQMAQYKDFLPAELLFPAVAAVAPDGVTDRAVKAAITTYEQGLTSVGTRPEFIPSVAYDPAMLVVNALRAVGPDATAAQLRDYINAIKDWPGTNGRYNFQATPQRGLSLRNVFVAKWNPSKNAWTAVSGAGGNPLH